MSEWFRDPHSVCDLWVVGGEETRRYSDTHPRQGIDATAFALDAKRAPA